MKTRSTSKRALLTSVLSIALCLSMLIGTTFAWFTDTASTSVNKIQAGKLDVALEMKDGDTWVSAEGKTLNFVKAQGHADEEILWEPGATYELPELRVVNNGNLALKYKVIISGIKGDAKLNEAIEWTMTLDGSDFVLGSEHPLAAKVGDTVDADVLTIKGHMKETVGNEYQNLFIDGIAITVVATQNTVEFDSIDDKYDQYATYPVAPTLGNTTIDGIIDADAETKLGNMADASSPTAAEIVIPAGAVNADTAAQFAMTLTESKPDSVTYEISLKDADGASVELTAPATVTANIGSGLTNVVVKHKGVAMTEVTAVGALEDGTYFYSNGSGTLMICTTSFSPFEISYEFNGIASLNGVAYTTLPSAIAAAKDGETVVLLKDFSTSSTTISIKDKKITLDLNGKEYNYGRTQYSAIQLLDNAELTIQNGTLNTSSHGLIVVGNGDKLTVNHVTINVTADGGVGVSGYMANCTVVVQDSEINSRYFGVYQNGSYGGNTYKISGTNITDTHGAGVYISNSISTIGKQNLTIDGCTISGPSAVEIKHTNATITNSTLIGTATPTTSGSNNNGTCSDGYSLAVTTNGVNDYVTGEVVVKGCTFYSGSTVEGAANGYVFVYQVAEGSSVTIDGNVVSNYNTYGGETSSAQ